MNPMTVDDVYNQYHLRSSLTADLLFKRTSEFEHGFEKAWVVQSNIYHPAYTPGE